MSVESLRSEVRASERRRRQLAFAGALFTASVIGCMSEPNLEGEALLNEDALRELSNATARSLDTFSNACTPIPALPREFLDAMSPCCGGKGRCIPNAPQLGKAGEQLETCDNGGKCAPLALLEVATKPLRKCELSKGMPGRCVPSCVDAIDRLKLVLPQDACEDDERCVPCDNPQDGKPTGLCELGEKKEKPAKCPPPERKGTPEMCASVADVIDTSKLMACSEGHCIPKEATDQASGVDAKALAGIKICDDGASYCVPDVILRTGGLWRPKECTAFSGAEGRCYPRFGPIEVQAKNLPIDVCADSERCIPCFDPYTGERLPTCDTPCDPGPKRPPVVFAPCVSGKGRCIPKSVVGSGVTQSLSFKKDTCTGEEICAPKSLLDRVSPPQTCEAAGGLAADKGPGVCVENVFSGVVKLGGKLAGLEQTSCRTGFVCMPCSLDESLPGCAAPAQ